MDDVTEVIQQAERIVWAAGWRLQEDRTLRQLAETRGLACARLEPRSEVIQLVTYDGEHLGHVRRDGKQGTEERWVAVLKDRARAGGGYTSALAAAEALAQACGKQLETGLRQVEASVRGLRHRLPRRRGGERG